MATAYTGDRTAAESPGPVPGLDVSPQVVIPADGDAATAASVTQAMKASADFIDWITHHMETRDYQSVVRFRENWLGYAVSGMQPTGLARSWRVVSVATDADTQVVIGASPLPGARVLPGTGSGHDAWLISAQVDGAGPAVLAGTGAFFDASAPGLIARAEWEASLTAATGDNTNWFQGMDDTSQTAKAFNNGDAGGGHATYAGFFKGSGQTRWSCVTGDGSAYTTTAQTVSAIVAINVPQLLKIEYDTTGTPTVRFYIDGALVATHTTHLPNTGLRLAFGGHKTGADIANNELKVYPVSVRINS